MFSRALCTIAFGWVLSSATAIGTPADNLAQAVRYRTVSEQDVSAIDYAQFEQFHAFLRATYPRVFATLNVETVAQHSLLLRWQGSGSSELPLLFTAHMDVVPIEPGTEGDWEHPPFDGVVVNGRIYGRGTLDDKQGLIGLLEAVEALLEEGFQPERTVVFAFGHDEEIGGREGAAAIARRMRELGLHFEWMVDEGGVILSDYPLLEDTPVAMVNVAEKRYFTITLVATGEGGHSSTPPQTSTIGRLSAALSRIEQNPFPYKLVGPVEAMLEALGPHASQPTQFVFNNLWLTGGVVAYLMSQERLSNGFVRTTTALTMVNAGVKENVVPQRAEAKINFRLLPGDTPEYVVRTIREIVADDEIEILYELQADAPPVADYTGSGFAVIKAATHAIYPAAVVVPSLLFGATDTRHYVDLVDNIYRYHGVLMASAQAQSVHGTNEYVGVDSFEKSIEVAKKMLQLGAGAH